MTSNTRTKISLSVPSYAYGYKLKDHHSVLCKGNSTLYMYGGENQISKEGSQKLVMLKLDDASVQHVDMTDITNLPTAGGVMGISTACCDLSENTLITETSLDRVTPVEPASTQSTKPHLLFFFGGMNNEEECLIEGVRGFSLDDYKWIEQLACSGTWEVPNERNGLSIVEIDSKYYLFGGHDHDLKHYDAVWRLDPSTMTFSFIHSKSEGRPSFIAPATQQHAACAHGSHMLVMGGVTSNQMEPVRYIYRFDTTKKKWIQPIDVPNDLYPEGLYDHAMTCVGDYLCIVGGNDHLPDQYDDRDEDTCPRQLSICHIPSGQWFTNFEIDGSMGHRVGHTVHNVGDSVWIVGGDIDNIADQDIAILNCSLFSEQENLSPAPPLKYDLVTISPEGRESFPPPRGAFDSVIITYKEGVQLNKWYGNRKQRWKLLFRASRDGWTSYNWHSKVDKQGPTITILKHSNGSIFGGYTPIPWDSSGADQYDDLSWIYSLKNPHDSGQYKFPKIPQSVARQRSVYHASGYAFWMGNNDILIYSNANTSASSNARLGKAFEYKLSHDASTFFCGSASFTLVEYETFGLA